MAMLIKFYTGDIAYKDKQNYYYIVGRKNKFIKLYGIRFNLEDIDRSLKMELMQNAFKK